MAIMIEYQTKIVLYAHEINKTRLSFIILLRKRLRK